jgi:dipeptidyl aminopeptidase/acylaminoacyl peptidase
MAHPPVTEAPPPGGVSLCETNSVRRLMQIVLGMFLAALWADAREPFTPADIWAWRTTEDPQISPAGRRVVYLERWNDRTTHSVCSNFWLMSVDGRERRPLTTGTWRDRSPRWSPDSERIAWLSDRSGKMQLYLESAAGGQAGVLQLGGLEPKAFAWSADGDWIALTAHATGDEGAAPWAPVELLPRLNASAFAGWPKSKLLVAPVRGGVPRELATGDLRVEGEPAWTLDGKTVLISARNAPLGDSQIYAVGLGSETRAEAKTESNHGSARALTHQPGANFNPLPSPDGGKIAWIAAEPRPGNALRKLCVMNSDGSRDKVLAGSLDRDVAAPHWSSDGRTVYFLADDAGATQVYAARADGTARQVTRRHDRLTGFSLADNGRAAAVRWSASEGAVEAGTVVSFAVDLPGGVTALAAPNDELLAARDIATAEEFRYDSAGRSIQAWLTRPARFDPAHTYPLVVDVEDRPGAMHGVETRLETQLLAARGWLVLTLNPRGTPGYGEIFANLLPTAYPGGAFEDTMRGVDAVLAKDLGDARRIAMVGGLLASWALGHGGRLHAVVVTEPVADLAGRAWRSPASLRRMTALLGAPPWQDPQLYSKNSPLSSAPDFNTPALLIARPGDVAAASLATALAARQVDSAFLSLNPEQTPEDRVLEWQGILAWLEKMLK